MSLKGILKKCKPVYQIYAKFKDKRAMDKRVNNLHKHGYQLLSEIAETFEKNNIAYFAEFGTLLGLYRDKAFTKRDYDIDLVVIETNNFSWDNVAKALSSIGMKPIHEFALDDSKITEMSFSKAGIDVDFFLGSNADDFFQCYAYNVFDKDAFSLNHRWNVISIHLPKVAELTKVTVHNVEVFFPDCPGLHCAYCYGDHWNIPDAHWNSSGNEKKLELKGHFGTIRMF